MFFFVHLSFLFFFVCVIVVALLFFRCCSCLPFIVIDFASNGVWCVGKAPKNKKAEGHPGAQCCRVVVNNLLWASQRVLHTHHLNEAVASSPYREDDGEKKKLRFSKTALPTDGVMRNACSSAFPALSLSLFTPSLHIYTNITISLVPTPHTFTPSVSFFQNQLFFLYCCSCAWTSSSLFDVCVCVCV
jgi:hypothetical protein